MNCPRYLASGLLQASRQLPSLTADSWATMPEAMKFMERMTPMGSVSGSPRLSSRHAGAQGRAVPDASGDAGNSSPEKQLRRSVATELRQCNAMGWDIEGGPDPSVRSQSSCVPRTPPVCRPRPHSLTLGFPGQIKGLLIQGTAQTEARDLAKRIKKRAHLRYGLPRFACQQNADDDHICPSARSADTSSSNSSTS